MTEDTPQLRKARGAFFTPEALCDYVVEWAVRTPHDHVFEPSCGEAAFLTAAGRRLEALSSRDAGQIGPAAIGPGEVGPGEVRLGGVELHGSSARQARAVLAGHGWPARILEGDFFSVDAEPVHDVVVGNPPYVRYQHFSGDARARAREVALAAGVPLSGLASSWAAFTVHAAHFLKPGGRLGLVLPAELLTVNYAAPVRRFLLQRFRSVRLVLFTERIFPGVLEEVVLLLADGFGQGPTDHCELIEAENVAALRGADTSADRSWRPIPPEGKWTASLIGARAAAVVERLREDGAFTGLETWGDTTLGMVTGNNGWFALSPARAAELALRPEELLRISPPGSRHLRGLDLDDAAWAALGDRGSRTLLFRPPGRPSAAARRYIVDGERAGVHEAYKCRVRTPWWRVPPLAPADLLITYMNADTPRIVGNPAGVGHLNSVHGVYLRDDLRATGRSLLPLGALTSMTLLGAELAGRAYGGGMLKLEPREADLLAVPVPELLGAVSGRLLELRPGIASALRSGGLPAAVALVDDVVLRHGLGLSASDVGVLREAAARLHARRIARGGSARKVEAQKTTATDGWPGRRLRRAARGAGRPNRHQPLDARRRRYSFHGRPRPAARPRRHPAARAAQHRGLGRLAKSIDAWLAAELRRAGFPADEIWPRLARPRVLPREVGLLLERLPAHLRPIVAEHVARLPSVAPSDARVLGRAYVKQVDVVMAQWARGPELLVSTKSMVSSFRNNLANRFEESYGDAKNLRGRHPLAAMGFLFLLRSTVLADPAAVERAVDMLRKLRAERDVYDATCLVIAEWDDETAEVAIRTDAVPEDLGPDVFLHTLVDAVLDRTPVEMHVEARGRRRLRPLALAEGSPQAGEPAPTGGSPQPDGFLGEPHS